MPFTCALLAEAPGDGDLSGAAAVLLRRGRAAAPDLRRRSAQRFGVPIRQLYGCTEAGAVTGERRRGPGRDVGARSGAPLEGVELAVRRRGRRAGRGRARIGEIAVRSPAMTRGYAGLDELNRDAFRDGWFLTGDRGRLDEEGRLFITGPQAAC